MTMHLRVDGLRIALAGSMAALVFLLPILSAEILWGGPTYSGSQVSLAPLIRAEKEKFALKPTHPANLSLETIEKSMNALAYQKREFFWSKKKHVFNPEAIKELAPQLQDKLSRADESSRVMFHLKNASGQNALRGDLFMTKDGLHWRITQIGDDEREVGDIALFGGPWRLVPMKDQEYKTTKKLYVFTGDITNWIVFARINNPSASVSVEGLKEKDYTHIQERLEMLKELKQEGLISDEDYQAKQREIMEGF